MRIVRCRRAEGGGSREFVGVWTGGGIVDLGDDSAPQVGDGAFSCSWLAWVDSALRANNRPVYPPDTLTFLPPAARPDKIFCTGVNCRDRNAEYRDGSAEPAWPSLFMRHPGSLVGHGDWLELPPESACLDHEGEIVLVIGRLARRTGRARARSYLAGLTLMNEGTIRDWIRHGKFNVTQGKNWQRSGSCGPWVETDLAAFDLEDLALECRVNGEVRQAESTSALRFSFAWLIDYISTFCELLPGDMIAMGTPCGAGGRLEPPRWLAPGDVVEMSAPGLGVLRNTVRREPAGVT